MALAGHNIPHILGVELDPVAAAVARVAVPTADIRVADNFAIADETDLLVGNPPASSRLSDKSDRCVMPCAPDSRGSADASIWRFHSPPSRSIGSDPVAVLAWSCPHR